eukprot:SAG22_NODE_583_length_8878_cov_47.533546_3_plen_142_part_00
MAEAQPSVPNQVPDDDDDSDDDDDDDDDDNTYNTSDEEDEEACRIIMAGKEANNEPWNCEAEEKFIVEGYYKILRHRLLIAYKHIGSWPAISRGLGVANNLAYHWGKRGVNPFPLAILNSKLTPTQLKIPRTDTRRPNPTA